MKHRKTPTSNHTFELPGGNEDNSLFVETMLDEAKNPCLVSVWELDDNDRAAIARGATVELIVWGTGTPPVNLRLGPSMDERKETA